MGYSWKNTVTLLFASVCLAAPLSHAQTGGYKPPKLSWDVPDLTGAWSNASITKLERPAGVSNLVLTPEQAAAIEGNDYNNLRAAADQKRTDPNAPAPEKGKTFPLIGNYNTAYIDAGEKIATINGERRSSWIVDPANGRIPFSETGKKRVSAGLPYEDDIRGAESAYLGPESRGNTERCLWSGGPIMLNGIYNSHFEIVQSPSTVMINVEMAHDARIIPIGKDAEDARKHFGPKAIPKWLGDSVGWYEGNTLVVESRNIHPKQNGIMLTAAGYTTERFTAVGEDELLYEFQVNDPELYTQPWRGEMQVTRLHGPVYEYACHEGNYGLINILLGARTLEAKGVKLKGAETTE